VPQDPEILGRLARAQARVGTVIRGKYRIDRVLGTGGMGVVYAATHRNRKQFAVKMLHPELSYREEIRTRFLREGYASNSVKHPGAVAVLDDDVSEDGAAFLVMELLDGASVEDVWERRERRIPLPFAAAIVDQLLDVLAAAHAEGIVHRDIKPANLFLTREGQIKVLDFGIARVRDAATGGDGTGTGTTLGTPAFMPPEQALAKTHEIDAQSDIWAAGATLFTLVTGRRVHEAENAPQLLVMAATVPASPLASVRPDTPPEVAAVVDRALAFEKGRRWPTATAMREALREAAVATLGPLPTRESLLSLLDGESVRPPQPPPGGILRTLEAPEMGRPSPSQASGSGSGSTAKPIASNPAPTQGGTPSNGRTRDALVAVAYYGSLAVLGISAVGWGAVAVVKAVSRSGPVEVTIDAGPVPATIEAGTADAQPERLHPLDEFAVEAGAESGATTTVEGRGSGRDASTPSVVPGGGHGGPVPATNPKCEIPYYLDKEGEKHFKPECFPSH
jgi:serine/threonine-protein kinase